MNNTDIVALVDARAARSASSRVVEFHEVDPGTKRIALPLIPGARGTPSELRTVGAMSVSNSSPEWWVDGETR